MLDPAPADPANWASCALCRSDFQSFRTRVLSANKHVVLGDLAAKVEWVADKVGEGLGYDIESFADDGSPVFIEVKTTKGPITTPFFVSEGFWNRGSPRMNTDAAISEEILGFHERLRADPHQSLSILGALPQLL